MKTANSKNPSFRQLLKSPSLLLGFGFGSGLAPKAPGTFGTLLGALLFIVFWNFFPNQAWLLVLFGILTGSWICGAATKQVGVHDHGGIVWDEFAGIWLVMWLLPEQNISYWLAAFISFRLFDILKPWPISFLDKKVSGGFGIMLDDLLAALVALIPIWIFYISL